MSTVTGNSLRDLRESLVFTHSQFAEFMGVSQSTTFRWEKFYERGIRIDPCHRRLVDLLCARVTAGRDPTALGGTIPQAIFDRGSLYALYVILREHFKHLGMA